MAIGRHEISAGQPRTRMLAMLNSVYRRPLRFRWRSLLFIPAVLAVGLLQTAAPAQGDPDVGDPGACVLKNHVYTCDGAAFQKALAAATMVEIETHNADGVARSQLKDLVTRKLGKSVAADGAPADLDFLMIPI